MTSGSPTAHFPYFVLVVWGVPTERETSYVQLVPSARGRTALGRVAASVSRPHQAAMPTQTRRQAVARSAVRLVERAKSFEGCRKLHERRNLAGFPARAYPFVSVGSAAHEATLVVGAGGWAEPPSADISSMCPVRVVQVSTAERARNKLGIRVETLRRRSECNPTERISADQSG